MASYRKVKKVVRFTETPRHTPTETHSTPTMVKWPFPKVDHLLHEASAYYAPKKEDAPPESALDEHDFKVKLAIVGVCVIIELVAYIILLVHYDGSCTMHYGASTCGYAIDKVRRVWICVKRLAGRLSVVLIAYVLSICNECTACLLLLLACFYTSIYI